MMIRLFLGLVLVVLSGCNECTLAGCSDTLDVQLGSALAQFGVGEPVSVKACIGMTCVTEVVTRPAGSGAFVGNAISLAADGTLRCTFLTRTAPSSEDITLTLKKNEVIVLDTTRRGAPSTSNFPNGESCGPVCQSANLALD